MGEKDREEKRAHRLRRDRKLTEGEGRPSRKEKLTRGEKLSKMDRVRKEESSAEGRDRNESG